jgi:hypothetical protein
MLAHQTVYEKSSLIAIQLPFIEELRVHHKGGSFPLLKDPTKVRESLIIGMFVLRPASSRPFTDALLDESGEPNSLYDSMFDWSYNLDGQDGGALVADSNEVDAYRLGMQYGLSDAVIIGTNTVCTEGVDKGDRRGYIWQAYGPLSWPHVQAVDPLILGKVEKQRKIWQELGYLSSRRYPALLVFTWTGQHYDGCPDFLQARAIQSTHPDGEPMEVYIITSQKGAERIRRRCGQFGLQERIDSLLITLPPPAPSSPSAEASEEVDLTLLPKLLYERYDIRIANHDGGQKVLQAFCKAGIVDQLNLTLGRGKTLRQVLESHSGILPATKELLASEFAQRVRFFFGKDSTQEGAHGIPRALTVASIISDRIEMVRDQVAVVTFAIDSTSSDWWK